MAGWRARIGFLGRPDNPTVEPETTEFALQGVLVHFMRLSASGSVGVRAGQDERTREQTVSLDDATRLLAMISPRAIAMAHSATSYVLGRDAEAALVRGSRPGPPAARVRHPRARAIRRS
jgi:maleate isomerase